jgi:hypothetical protein
METVENRAGPYLVMVVERNFEAPDRRTQDMGSKIVAATASRCSEALFLVALDGLARPTLYGIMIGFGPTATFEPDQISRPMTLDLPEPESFAALMAFVESNRRRGTESVEGKPDTRKPRKAVIAITSAAFIKPFLRFYFSTVANRPNDPNFDEFISYGAAVVLDTITHEVKILQT